MKNVMKTLMLLIFGSFSMSAQISQPLVAKVPFDFSAGFKSFPAGEYKVLPGPVKGIVTIGSSDGKITGFVSSLGTISLRAQTHSRLIFNRYGNQYFLSQIWIEGTTSGAELYQTPAEREAALKAAAARTSIIASKHSQK